MFYLHVSNRTENLLLQMAEVMRVDPQPHLFDKELFLIQSQGMERMIGQTLADECGCFCNYQFFLPLGFLEFIADRLGVGITPDGFQRQVLTWRIDSLLRELEDDVYRPLKSYISGANSSLKRFQLARRLANLFDQYQIMRPEMLQNWERGESGQLTTGHSSESWQVALWRSLLKQPGGEMHRGRQLSNLIQHLEGKDKEKDQLRLPKRVNVIGLHTLPPILLDFLNGLSGHMDVHLFLLSPCRNYWGNVESERVKFKRLLKNQVTTSIDEEQHHPLLATLGRQGRDLQNLMLENADFALEFASYQDPLEGGEYEKAPLLQRLQADLLEGQLPDNPQVELLPEDNSVQLVSCHSKFREITILKDHLLKILHLDPRLELRDIIVMAPDIQEYAAIIPAVFSDIQHSVADRSMKRRNSVMAAFLRFLQLFSGRYGWSEVFDFLRLDVIYPRFQLSLSDLDNLQRWVVGAGIRWGLSERQRKEDGLAEFSTTSWREGLDRLLMGYAIDSDEAVDGVLPFTDVEGRAGISLGGLCRFIDLLEETRDKVQRPCSLSDWSRRLQVIVEQLFGEEKEQELAELRTLVYELEESISPFHEGEVDFEVLQEWFTQSAGESRSSSGFLRGQLTFCSMLPMRSIPFQVVCLIGLNDGVFPKNDTQDTFDLMATTSRPGDRSARADDRYQFMEAMLAARSKLYLSFIGQSIKSNETVPPSVVVTELLEVLESAYGARDLVICHPLHPFSRKYFDQNPQSGLFSFDEYYCNTAKAIQERGEKPTRWWQGVVREEEAGDGKIPWNELLRFYANPQKYFVRDCLGIPLDHGESLPEDHENFEISGLEKYAVEQELVQSGLAAELDGLCEKLQIRGRWPLGTSGKLAFDEKRLDVEQFIELVQEQNMGERLPDVSFNLKLSGRIISGNLSNIYENGLMLLRFGPLRGRDLLYCWLHHLLAKRLKLPAVTTIVATDTVIAFGDEMRGAELDLFLDHFSDGCRRPSQFYVEPALAYARQATNSRARIAPLDKALGIFRDRLEKGYEPEWQLLLGDAGLSLEMVTEFETLCQRLLCPVWEEVDGR